MFFQIANAAETTPKAGIMNFVPVVLIFVIFYFFVIRPQSKKMKDEQKMRDGLQIGNKIVTTSGIFGTITEIDTKKSLVSVSIAKDVTIVMYKTSISNILKEKDDEPKNGE